MNLAPLVGVDRPVFVGYGDSPTGVYLFSVLTFKKKTFSKSHKINK